MRPANHKLDDQQSSNFAMQGRLLCGGPDLRLPAAASRLLAFPSPRRPGPCAGAGTSRARRPCRLVPTQAAQESQVVLDSLGSDISEAFIAAAASVPPEAIDALQSFSHSPTAMIGAVVSGGCAIIERLSSPCRACPPSAPCNPLLSLAFHGQAAAYLVLARPSPLAGMLDFYLVGKVFTKMNGLRSSDFALRWDPPNSCSLIHRPQPPS
jgi:hypothetical protein